MGLSKEVEEWRADPRGAPRLERSGATSRVMKIGSVAEANAARRDVERIMRAWCEWRRGSA